VEVALIVHNKTLTSTTGLQDPVIEALKMKDLNVPGFGNVVLALPRQQMVLVIGVGGTECAAGKVKRKMVAMEKWEDRESTFVF
jgi:hypothetical protein